MRSELLRAAAASLLLTVAPGCGILGDKPEIDKILEIEDGNKACLDELGPNVEKFMAGEIAREDWEGTWDCVIAALADFRKLTRGSVEGGYTQGDMRNFVSLFLLTGSSASDGLMSASFSLKASLLGGLTEVITLEELDRLVDLLETAKRETSGLIPHLARRREDHGPESMAAFARALAGAADALAGSLHTAGNSPLARATMETLFSELSSLHGIPIDPAWAGIALAAKNVLVGGSEDVIEAEAWPSAIRIGGVYGGAAAALMGVDWDSMDGVGAHRAFFDALGPFPPPERGAVPLEAVEAFVRELAAIDGFDIDPQWARVGFLAKSLVVGGESATIETGEWAALLRLVRPYGAVAMTAMKIDWLRQRALDEFRDLIASLAPLPVPDGAPITLQGVQELTDALAGIDGFDPVDPAWLRLGFALKAVVVGGPDDRIEASDWDRATRLAAPYGAAALHFMRGALDEADGLSGKAGKILETIDWLRPAIEETFDAHGGAIQASLFDTVIAGVPAEKLPIPGDVIGRAIRPFFKNMLESSSPELLPRHSFALLRDQAAFWVRGQGHLETIFGEFDLEEGGVSRDEFARAAALYAQGLESESAREEVNRLVYLAREFRPFFFGSDKQITFARSTVHSLHNLSTLHWADMGSRNLIRSYSSVPGKQKAKLEDLRRFVNDFQELGGAFKVIHLGVPNLPEKRFREADLFTFGGNGDDFLDINEGVNYFPFLVSAKVLSDRMMSDIEPICFDPELGYDQVGHPWMGIECFRREFFSRIETYWDHFPGLSRYWRELPDDERQQLADALEQGARRYGKNDLPIASYDVEGFAGVVHYIEAIFTRYDTDGNQHLNVPEVLGAYPVFKNVLATIGQLDPSNDGMIEAAFTFTVRYGRPPKRDFWGTLEFLGWLIKRPFWSIHAPRLNVYKIISVLAVPSEEPEPPDAPSAL